MSDKKRISGGAVAINKRINLADTIRLAENMASVNTVLFTDISCSVTKNEVTSGSLYLSGNCKGELIYLSESENADRMSFSLPFDISEVCEADWGVFWGDCSVSSYEITPIKGRRCDVSIYLDITGYVFPQNSLGGFSESGVQYRVYKNSSLKDVSQLSSVTAKETYEFSHPSGFEDGVKIVYANAEVFDIRTNHSPAGILINGFIRQNIIYSVLNDEDVYVYYAISENTAFNRFCEVGYDTKYDDYSVMADISSADTYIRQTENESIICMDVTLNCGIILLSDEKAENISDIYSPDMNLTFQNKEVNCCKIRKILQKELKLSDRININYELLSAKVVSGKESVEILTFHEDNSIRVDISVEIMNILLRADAGKIDIHKCRLHESFTAESDHGKENRYIAKYNINEIFSAVSDGRMDVTCNMTVDVYEICDVKIYEPEEILYEEYPPQVNDFVSVRIYYDVTDDSVFSIARQSRKSPEEIALKKKESGENSPMILWDSAE